MSTRGIKLHTTYGPCYVRDFFVVCFRSYFFVHASLKLSIGKGRPDTVVEVWAQSEQCGARGGRSKFCRREYVRRFPGGSVRGLIHFHTYVQLVVIFARGRAQTTDNTAACRVHAYPRPPDYKITTLPPSTSSRQHHARVTGPRCAEAICFYRSLRSTIRPHHYLGRCCMLCVVVS